MTVSVLSDQMVEMSFYGTSHLVDKEVFSGKHVCIFWPSCIKLFANFARNKLKAVLINSLFFIKSNCYWQKKGNSKKQVSKKFR